MGTMVGTVITVKELYGIKSADIQFRNGTNSTSLITLEENRLSHIFKEKLDGQKII